MEVLVLIDFEGTTGDELTLFAGDVVTNVTLFSEEGWMEGELRGKRGIFPANFVKEVPVSLLGDSQREPRSLRKSNMLKQQCRKCEVIYAYTPMHQDELELVVGETIELLREIEDGWWMGKRNGKIGAFPSNFVKEIFVSPKEAKLIEGKSRPKLSDAIFSKEGIQQQRASIRKKTNVKETCQVMFDYSARAEDELDLKKGDIVSIISKVSEDDGWWEGELNGQRGFFPDNFVMLIPVEALQEEKVRPLRRGSENRSAKKASGMDKGGNEAKTKTEAKEEKAEIKDFRSDLPGKIKLPGMFKPTPPPIKDKPSKFVPKPSDDHTPASPKHTDSKPNESDQFDGVDVSSAKLSHFTANRAKPPQRRPPTGLGTGSHPSNGSTENVASEETDGFQKATVDNLLLNNGVVIPPQQTTVIKVQEETPSMERVLAELKDLRMALELFKAQHETDMKDLKEELQEERNKRMKLQDEVQVLRKQK